ncbi:MAG: lipopolysaccharide kinase InaA family protein [Thermoanaerobaculia bacterium]|nr:lipopolysaccharide kinase InaA family protein [Thermoanaerobaculia bacterium]
MVLNRLKSALRIWQARGIGYPVVFLIRSVFPAVTRAPLRRPGLGYVKRGLNRMLSARGGRAEFGVEVPVHGAPVGRIDNDGRLLSPQPFAGFHRVTEAEFVARRRFDLDIRNTPNGPTVVKCYRRDRQAFSRELEALRRLEREGVPAPRVVGFERMSLTLQKTLVQAPTLRQILVDRGARILTCQIEEEAGEEGPKIDHEEVWRRGREALAELDPAIPGQLALLLEQIHNAGVTGASITFGNVCLDEDLGPVLIDFDKAQVHRRTSTLAFAAGRDHDRRLFNRIYGSDLLTETGAARLLKEVSSTGYAPLDLGQGLFTKGCWSIDSGTGRWEYLNRRVLEPIIQGSRIVDLGSHNGVMPLLMLRDGAEAVVAFERNLESARISRLTHRLFEWRYHQPFDFRVINNDMLAGLRSLRGEFDVITSFCSLYYLSEVEMLEAAVLARSLAPVFVVQAKTDTRAGAGSKAIKSGDDFLKDLLLKAGFSTVERFGPTGYSRPILIALR